MPDTPLNPDALRRAADAVSELYADGHCPKAEDAAEVAVSAYLAAALPEVTSVEELDQLPAETVIKDASGFVFEQNTLDPRLKAQWVATGSKYPVVTECIELPARVLYRPEVKP